MNIFIYVGICILLFLFLKINYLRKKVKSFFKDQYGGNLVEYVLLVGFALFIFFLIIGAVSGLFEWLFGFTDELPNFFEDFP